MAVRRGPVRGREVVNLKRTRTGKKSKIQEEHSHSVLKKGLFILALVVIIVLASGIIITIGPMPITVLEVYCTLINKFIPDIFSISRSMENVVWLIRMPRIMGAILVGLGLGICGCVMQAVLKNPLASPFTLGISSGAQFGVSLAAVFGITILGGPFFLIGNAFVFALLCSGVIIALSGLKGATSETMVLAGIALNYLFQATNQLFNYIANDDQRSLMSAWGMGSISGLNWNSIMVIGIATIICVPLLYSKAWDLNLMTIGDEGAKSMGVDAGRVRLFIMVVSSFLVAALVAFVGVIGFIGLVAPHIGRLILGSDHRYLILAAGAIGAILLLVADAISVNLLAPTVIPTGTIMAVIGVPFFLYLILRGRRREYWS
ncbi:MAG: Cobalamin import system permease protein BtuC [Methanoregulaceae archaeon PtaB.Bin056]|jgi:iron complex transport system permease protein|nr:MAG: Cobalamin import system permease protein BtuC [Methanoregulaceae archaeon PtaB.Bin056]